MPSKKHRKLVRKAFDQVNKDRISLNRKAQIDEMHAREADAEARTVFRAVQHVTVTCPFCTSRSEHELIDRVPVAECPNCHKKLVLATPGQPRVVSR